MAKDSIEMKADLSDFITAQGKLQTQENKLIDILGRYSNLKKRATEFIEEDDSRFSKMQEVIEEEIKKVKSQLKSVQAIEKRIDAVVKAMDSMEESSTKIMQESKETIKEGVEAIIDLKKLDSLGL